MTIATYDQVFTFTAPNEEVIYGYGSEDEALAYLRLLNDGREVHLYEKEVASIQGEEAEGLAFVLRDADERMYDDDGALIF